MEPAKIILSKPCSGCGGEKFQQWSEPQNFDGVTVYFYRCLNCEWLYTVNLHDGVDDLQKGIWDRVVLPSQRCRSCSEPTEPILMREGGVCVLCEQWFTLSGLAHCERMVRVNGHHFYIEDEDSSFYGFRGFGSQEFTIRFFDGRVVTTTNLWAQGKIPQHFQQWLPDNAEFVGQKPF